jgi:aryl-alcohol dehydrogenase-like predicted oxidoreductase
LKSPAKFQHSVLENVIMGTGTWAWGDRLYWGYGRDYNKNDLYDTFLASLEGGIKFFDSAEIYAQGRSEMYLGEFIAKRRQIKNGTNIPGVYETRPIVATKFMPFPWRLGRRSLKVALKRSLKRLGVSKIDLYQIHWPAPPVAVETWIEAMIEEYQEGKITAIGISNFNRTQMQRAYAALTNEGVQLTSNQVEYNLLNRNIEKNGLLKHCHDAGVSVLAYSPLSMGVLTGKYTAEKPPLGIRSRRYNPKFLAKITPLLSLLKQIGNDRAGKTPAQVALNWVICKGAIPIPGAKSPHQVAQNSGAVGWALSHAEVERLDDMSDQLLIDD